MPVQEEVRKKVKAALERGKTKHVKRSGNLYGKCAKNNQLNSYDYREAGFYPLGAPKLREQLLPQHFHRSRQLGHPIGLAKGQQEKCA